MKKIHEVIQGSGGESETNIEIDQTMEIKDIQRDFSNSFEHVKKAMFRFKQDL